MLYKEYEGLTANQQKQYFRYLDSICSELEIPPGKFNLAKERYESVGKYLCESQDTALQDAEIYSQGSLKIGTTVKPLNKEEFDVDLVCFLPNASTLAPDSCRNKVYTHLESNGNYSNIVEEINRGCRLNYADDFHMDITPGVEDRNGVTEQHAISVPDKKLKAWKASNPRGYAEWFNDIATKEPQFDSLLLEERVALSANENIEELPNYAKDTSVLRRAVQLMKRHRDVIFNTGKLEKYKEHAPISILITTLAARAYDKAVNNGTYKNELELLLTVIEDLPNYIESKNHEFWVTNPKNNQENFAEKWNEIPRRFIAFDLWHKEVKKFFKELSKLEGIDVVTNSLKEAYGERVTTAALNTMESIVTTKRGMGALGVTGTGMITGVKDSSATTSIPKNTFYGKK